MENDKTVGKEDGRKLNRVLRILKIVHDLKAKDLAGKIGISPSYLSLIESGNRPPSLEIIQRYSEIFDIKKSTLFSLTKGIDVNNFWESMFSVLKVIVEI